MDEIGKLKDVVFDLDSGINNVIINMSNVLKDINIKRWGLIQSGYDDVFKNIEHSSEDNKFYLLDDIADAIDLSCPEGWRFGQDEEFSATYCFWPEDPSDAFFDN